MLVVLTRISQTTVEHLLMLSESNEHLFAGISRHTIKQSGLIPVVHWGHVCGVGNTSGQRLAKNFSLGQPG